MNSCTPSRDTVVWTIGHSTRPIDEFLGLLADYGIQTLVDVRHFPGSRRYPQYGKDALEHVLQEHGYHYLWFKDLGGRRPTTADSPNITWRNASFRGYADYMSTPDFKHAFNELCILAGSSRIALMCAEAVWWRCHRSMISDALCVQRIQVIHILDAKHSSEHPMTSPARVVNGNLTYTPAP